jgi:hypothetical protein
MGLGDGIRAGLMLREFIDTRQSRAEEAKLKARLFKSQAEHYESQNKLVEMKMAQSRQYMEAMLKEQIPMTPFPTPQPQGIEAFSGAGTQAPTMLQAPDITPQQQDVIHRGSQAPTSAPPPSQSPVPQEFLDLLQRSGAASLMTGDPQTAAQTGYLHTNLLKLQQAYTQQQREAEAADLINMIGLLHQAKQPVPPEMEHRLMAKLMEAGHAPQAAQIYANRVVVLGPKTQAFATKDLLQGNAQPLAENQAPQAKALSPEELEVRLTLTKLLYMAKGDPKDPRTKRAQEALEELKAMRPGPRRPGQRPERRQPVPGAPGPETATGPYEGRGTSPQPAAGEKPLPKVKSFRRLD